MGIVEWCKEWFADKFAAIRSGEIRKWDDDPTTILPSKKVSDDLSF